jgi:hypothetical protein
LRYVPFFLLSLSKGITMITPPPAPAPTPVPAHAYQAPAIVHKAQLKHFSGSPLAVDPNSPENVLGLPQ